MEITQISKSRIFQLIKIERVTGPESTTTEARGKAVGADTRVGQNRKRQLAVILIQTCSTWCHFRAFAGQFSFKISISPSKLGAGFLLPIPNPWIPSTMILGIFLIIN